MRFEVEGIGVLEDRTELDGDAEVECVELDLAGMEALEREVELV